MADNARAAVKAVKTTPPAGAAPPGEHIYLGSDDGYAAPPCRTVAERASLVDRLRRAGAELTLYAEGLLEVREQRRGAAREPFRLELHYLDPVPAISRFVARGSLAAAAGCGAVAALAVAAARLTAQGALLWPAAGAAAIGALASLLIALHRSHERTTFVTLHGRAPVLALTAHLGSVRRFRAFVPVLSRAIEDAADRIGDDTSAFLRAEMREHYRLRKDGVLTQELCAAGTGRILEQFDLQI
jgi:hypothetical protein